MTMEVFKLSTLFTAATLLASSGAGAQQSCSQRDAVISLLAQKYQETPVALGVTSTGDILEVLSSGGVEVVIDHIKIEILENDGKKEDLPVCYFNGKEKGLVLKKTNRDTLIDIFGDVDPKELAGKTVFVYRTKTDYMGKRVDCLRLKAAVAASGDDIPF